MAKNKPPKCKTCIFWVKDSLWAVDKRSMGDCHLYPPELCQTLIPAVIRASGYGLLRQKQEEFQRRPVTEFDSFCSFHQPKDKP